jgi:hypothetical protein
VVSPAPLCPVSSRYRLLQCSERHLRHLVIVPLPFPSGELAMNPGCKIVKNLSRDWMTLVFSCCDFTNKIGFWGKTCFQWFYAKISCWRFSSKSRMRYQFLVCRTSSEEVLSLSGVVARGIPGHIRSDNESEFTVISV